MLLLLPCPPLCAHLSFPCRSSRCVSFGLSSPRLSPPSHQGGFHNLLGKMCPLGQCFPNLGIFQNHLECLFNHRFLDATSGDSDTVYIMSECGFEFLTRSQVMLRLLIRDHILSGIAVNGPFISSVTYLH